jgi:hypothetical protein
MDVGILIKYGKFVPEREVQALEFYTETREFLADYQAKGWITSFEPFTFSTGDFEDQQGFWLIKCPQEYFAKLVELEAFRWLIVKAQFLFEHFEVDYLKYGEAIAQQVEWATKVAAEFAPVGIH